MKTRADLVLEWLEKTLKGYLIFLDTEFPRTHSIGTLISLAAEKDSSIALFMEAGDSLTDFSVCQIPYRLEEAEKTDWQGGDSRLQSLRHSDSVLISSTLFRPRVSAT